MSSYESGRSEFRPKPDEATLFVFGLSGFLLADLIHSVLTWAIETVLAFNSGWEKVVILDIPVLTNPTSPFYVSPPLGPPWIWSGEIVAGTFLALSAALVFLWPTRSTLASRLFVHVLAIVLVLEGTIASSLVYTDILTTSIVRSRVLAAISLVLALVLLVAVQRRLLVVFQQFWETRELGVRITLFTILELPGLALLAGVFWFGEFRLGAVAALATTLPLLIAQLFHSSRPAYERVTAHRLTAATIVVTILALAGIGGSIWAFGSDLIDLPRRALTWSKDSGFEVKTHETIFHEQLRDRKENEMLIRWSEE